jgi:hypothetical protein
MQSRSTKAQPNDSVDHQSPSSSPSTQHGFHHGSEVGPSPSLHRQPGESSPLSGGDNDTLSISSGSSSRGRTPYIGLRQLKNSDSSSQGGSSGSRVDLHEKSHNKKPDGVSFKIIPSGRPIEHRVSVNQFPNGESCLVWHCRSVLTVNRGPHPHPFPHASNNIVDNEPSF